MAGFGFGGLGSSFPIRTSTPQSQAVDYLGTQDDYLSDWNKRFAELAAMGHGATSDQWVDPSSAPGGYATYKALLSNPNAQLRQGTLDPSNPGGSLTQVFMKGQDEYTPDFTALNNEKLAKQAQFSNQIAQQQAYNGMNGNGQFNGIPTGDYSAPGFGQVTGQQNPYAVDVPSGVNLPQTSGTYGAGQQTGIYNPQAASAKNPWGL